MIKPKDLSILKLSVNAVYFLGKKKKKQRLSNTLLAGNNTIIRGKKKLF